MNTKAVQNKSAPPSTTSAADIAKYVVAVLLLGRVMAMHKAVQQD